MKITNTDKEYINTHIFISNHISNTIQRMEWLYTSLLKLLDVHILNLVVPQVGSKCLTLLSACSCSYCVYHPLCHSAITSKTYFPVPSVSTIIPVFLQTPVRHISCSCCVYHPVWDSSINRKTYFLLLMCLPSFLSFCNDQ